MAFVERLELPVTEFGLASALNCDFGRAAPAIPTAAAPREVLRYIYYKLHYFQFLPA